MFPDTTALSLIDQHALTGERAWVGDIAPGGMAFAVCDLYRLPGFRPAVEHFGRYQSVWLVQEPLSIQGWRILLDSCIRMLTPEGTLVVRYLQNQHLSVHALKGFLFRKYGLHISVRSEVVENGVFVTAFQIVRAASALPKEKKWTFGILTQGKKVDLIERFCRSVREYGGPDHQILIVGPRHSVYEPYAPTYIDKTYSAAFSDICVKKNDIINGAEHENVCILHDRYILNKDFFSGFDTFGYDFDYLTIRQHHASGKIYPSYCATDDGRDLIWGPIFECGNENETWGRHYLNGGLIIGKRTLLRAVPFNSLIFHNQAEDVELAKALDGHSVLPRINRLSSAVTDVPDHLTDAFAYAEHPWAPPPVPEIQPVTVPVQEVTAAPMLVADLNGVPWRRVRAVGRRVRNLRRDGRSWAGVAKTAVAFVRRRLSAKLQGPSDAVGLHQTAAASASSLKRAPADSEGVNLLLYSGVSDGHFNLTTHYMRRLLREEVPFCVIDVAEGATPTVLPPDLVQYLALAPVYPRNIWCFGFPFVTFHLEKFPSWVENRWNVNLSNWELPFIPQRLAGNFARLDGLMTNSEFVRDAMAGVTSVPIEVVDPQVRIDPAIVAPYNRAYFGLPADKKLFLMNWDYTSSTIRKNPEAGVRAFEEAFGTDRDDVALVMHVKIGATKEPAVHAEYAAFLEEIKARHPHLIVIDRKNFTYEEALGLKNVCDCYVSLHRSEGYGMGCAEALSMGRYCLMTGWSGNMEMLKTAAWRPRIATVEVALIPVTPADFPWVDDQDEVFQLWADVRPGDAAQKMRAVLAAMIENKGVGQYVV
jgi:hypothetical protein